MRIQVLGGNVSDLISQFFGSICLEVATVWIVNMRHELQPFASEFICQRWLNMYAFKLSTGTRGITMWGSPQNKYKNSCYYLCFASVLILRQSLPHFHGPVAEQRASVLSIDQFIRNTQVTDELSCNQLQFNNLQLSSYRILCIYRTSNVTGETSCALRQRRSPCGLTFFVHDGSQLLNFHRRTISP